MIGQKGPGITANAGFGEQGGEAIDKALPVMIVAENITALDTSNNYVLEQTSGFKSG